jgi:hypothetical protein
MLLFKEREEEQPKTIAALDTGVENHTALLPDRSNEELLAELQTLSVAQRSNRMGIIGAHMAGIALSALVIIGSDAYWTMHPTGNFTLLLSSLFGSLAFIPVGFYTALRIGRSFFKRSREQLHAIIPALEQRGEVRALPQLLALMDVKYSGILMWQETRPVFLQALETLLVRVTPEQFQEFSREQLWNIIMMLYFADGRLREVTVETVVRCGDNRAVEALNKLRGLASVGPTNPRSLFYRLNPMVRFLQKQGVPLPTEEARDAIERALNGLSANVDEVRRTAQLLRASAPDAEQKARELLRASAPTGIATPREQLLRPTLPSEVVK